MKKNFRKLAMMASCIALALASCQKEEAIQQSNVTTIGNPAKSSSKLSKNWVDNYEDCVYIPTSRSKKGKLDTYQKYRTLRIKNLDETIIQEWLLDDLSTTSLPGCHQIDFDKDGTKDYTFYNWAKCGNDLKNRVIWDTKILLETGKNIKGFHLPTEKDIYNLCACYNDVNTLIEKLELNQSLALTKDLNTSKMNLTPRIWIDFPYETHPECGTSLYFITKINDSKESIMLYQVNQPYDYCLVRLVRNLTIDEW